ncbi:MAG: peptidase M1 [Flavobacterium sp. BFFFF2]|nr:MAG: peptidase M1 [Flavobacterium sp. BFFFF2]
MNTFYRTLVLLCAFPFALIAQKKGYWQQQVNYKMEVQFDVKSYKYKGNLSLTYENNSGDTLRTLYFHLYPNAFQPGSEMDQRLQQIADPDRRMVNKLKNEEGKTINKSRIADLKPNEIGYLHLSSISQDGQELAGKEAGTIYELPLKNPLLPNKSTSVQLQFDGQLPIQIRRSGRNNKESVALSMAQWYPKLCEFDEQGWHADPYIAREFFGVWGNFDVSITLDKNYLVGGTGVLQNPQEIGFGYEKPGAKVVQKVKDGNLTWHFKAEKVHDFTWAADPTFLHDVYPGPNNVSLHFIYKNNPTLKDIWKKVQPLTATIMAFYNEHVGPYPYPQYSIIQGGDGGMEYAMCTLILGEGDLNGLTGLIAHEMGHSWFQQVLASNESKNPWMDEGFTTYIEDWVMNEMADKKTENPFKGSYDNYRFLAKSGKEQPLSTHGDRYDENRSYSIASYSKGAVFLAQLNYLIGDEFTQQTIKRFYKDFAFKHPTPNDLKRTAERVSGALLDSYLVDWTQTTNTIDYAIKTISPTDSGSTLVLERIGRTAMPIDLEITLQDGTVHYFYIPLRDMHFNKAKPKGYADWNVATDWPWAQSVYTLSLPWKPAEIKRAVIDPKEGIADVNLENNQLK